VKDSRSILGVNLLYTVAFVSLLVGSVALAGLSLGWRLVVNELVFLGVPIGVYVLVSGGRPRDLFRLRPVSWKVAALALVVGLGLWRFDWWVAALFGEVLDYTVPLPPDVLNLTLVDKIAMAVGTVILAPIVEEVLFRGILQSAYERLGSAIAVAVSALLFVGIHQEPAQSIAILPVALALAYVTWRTQSVVPAILAHFGNNAQALAVSLLQGSNPQSMAFAPSGVGALVGLLAALASLALITALTSPEREQRRVMERGWLASMLPLIPLVPLYAALVGLSLLLGLRPEALALGRRVALDPGPWEEKTRWTYEINNAAEEQVGQADCTLQPEADSFVLECEMEQSAYEIDAASGFFKDGAVTQTQTTRWDRETMSVLDAEIEASYTVGEEQATLEALVSDGGLRVRVDEEGQTGAEFEGCYQLEGSEGGEGVPPAEEPCRVEDDLLAGGGVFSPLLAGEWPWRFSALPMELAYSREARVLWPYRSVDGVEGRAPAEKDVFVIVRTAEQVTTPAGEFVTWRVTVGEKYTAWYTVETPHHLVAYSDDMVTWRVSEIE